MARLFILIGVVSTLVGCARHQIELEEPVIAPLARVVRDIPRQLVFAVIDVEGGKPIDRVLVVDTQDNHNIGLSDADGQVWLFKPAKVGDEFYLDGAFCDSDGTVRQYRTLRVHLVEQTDVNVTPVEDADSIDLPLNTSGPTTIHVRRQPGPVPDMQAQQMLREATGLEIGMGDSQAWRVLESHGFRRKPEPPMPHSGETWYVPFIKDQYPGRVLVLYCINCESARRDEDTCVRAWYAINEKTKTVTEDPEVFRRSYRRVDKTGH